MGERAKAEWIADRAFAALYIASHRGHMKLVNKLIDTGTVNRFIITMPIFVYIHTCTGMHLVYTLLYFSSCFETTRLSKDYHKMVTLKKY